MRTQSGDPAGVGSQSDANVRQRHNNGWFQVQEVCQRLKITDNNETSSRKKQKWLESKGKSVQAQQKLAAEEGNEQQKTSATRQKYKTERQYTPSFLYRQKHVPKRGPKQHWFSVTFIEFFEVKM